jgi:hypothetical protein
MKVFQVAGYPRTHYFVKSFQEFLEIRSWMMKNDVGYLHESSSIHGYGFSVRKNFEWFALRWL